MRAQIGLTYTNKLPVLSLRYCLCADCAQSRSLHAFKVEIISPGLNFMTGYQPFRIDSHLTEILLEILLAVSEMHQKVFQQSKMDL